MFSFDKPTNAHKWSTRKFVSNLVCTNSLGMLCCHFAYVYTVQEYQMWTYEKIQEKYETSYAQVPLGGYVATDIRLHSIMILTVNIKNTGKLE